MGATTLDPPVRPFARRQDCSSEEVHLEEVSEANERDWDQYVDSRPDATCYHLRAWQRVARHAYRLATPFLIARGNHSGRVRGVLPLFVVKNPMGGYLTTGLFGAYGAVLADSGEVRHALLDSGCCLTRAHRLAYFVHKSLGEETLPADFKRHDPCVTAVLPLASPDVIWHAFRSEIRNRIRKSERSGFEIKTGVEQLPAFYDVLARNMHRKGTPIYGFDVMRELVCALQERVEVLTLSRSGETVSGALLVYYNGTVSVPFVSSRAASLPWCPNNLVYWEVIRRGWARGMRTLDFGRSFRNSSNLEFKLRFGARTVSQPFFVHTRTGREPRLDANDRSIRGLIGLWKRLPLAVANALGPWLCRRFLV